MVRDWLRGWYETIKIRVFEPELFKALCEPIDGEDFGEVGPPMDYAEADEAHDYNEWARLWGPDGKFTKRDKP